MSDNPRWGIIYSPKDGVRRKDKVWNTIREKLDDFSVKYDFVQSEKAESVERLAKMLAQNGYKTIIIVGGDAALNRAINGILSVNKDIHKTISLGVIPNGWGNDFAGFWGFDENNYSQTIQILLRGRIRKVDVGQISSIDGNNMRYFLNCVDIGLTAEIMNIRHKIRRLGSILFISHIIAVTKLLMRRAKFKMHIRINQTEIKKSIMSLCIGSAHGYGQTPSAVPYNGLLDVSVVSTPPILQMTRAIFLLLQGRFLNQRIVSSHRTKKISIESYDNAKVSLDGAIWSEAPSSQLIVTIKKEHIQFIIP